MWYKKGKCRIISLPKQKVGQGFMGVIIKKRVKMLRERNNFCNFARKIYIIQCLK